MKFSSVFQSAVSYSTDDRMTAEQLLSAFDNVATAQVDIIPTRVDKIVKSLVKEGQLYIRPTVAIFDDKAFLVSGRHRTQGILEFCRSYGLNAAGKVVKYTGDINDQALTPIEPEILVEVIYAKDMATIGHLQMEYNGSRSMTAAETNLVKETFTKLTALAKIQMAFATKIGNLLPVTFQTALSIAKTVSTAFPKLFVYSTDEQLETLSIMLYNFYSDNVDDEEIVPNNMARNYKKLVTAFLDSELGTDNTDEDGEQYTDTVRNIYASGLVKPDKAAKANSKVDELKAQIEALTAKLQAAGVASV